MIDLLFSIDVAIFFFINHTLSNPLFDLLMPFLTDLNRYPSVLIAVGMISCIVIWKGGKTGRITIGLLILTVIISDQLNSSILKELFGRIRPCRTLDGVRMLVDCGGGLSFPSSHAVNNFAGAAIISHFYPKHRFYWFSFASLVAFSRPYVGVHYPSDIVAGSIVGFGIALLIILLWNWINSKFIKSPSELNPNSL